MADDLILSMIKKVEAHDAFLSNKSRIEGITNELRMIADLLRDKKLGEGRRLNYLTCDLVEMVNYALDAMSSLHSYSYLPCDFWDSYDYQRSTEVIGSTRRWVEAARKRLLQFGFDDEVKMESENTRNGEDVVGLKDDVELLLREAIFSEKLKYNREPISLITGMVGIGKTTLARELYNHKRVVDGFESRAWVCVSSDFSHKQVLIKLIKQVVDSEELQIDSCLDSLDNKGLQEMLHQRMKGRRYFIVLDDLPKEIHLKSILEALPKEKGSRLLLTSSSQDSQSTFLNYTHEMKLMDFNKSWQLFLTTVFNGNKFTSNHNFPERFKRKGREVMKKCDGLPLAIKVAGRQLAQKIRSGSDWEEGLESIDFDAVLVLLESYYHELSQEVKSSFLHLAFFKENTTVRAGKLHRIWESGDIFSRDYYGSIPRLKKMVSESIIEVKDTTIGYPSIKSCRVNAVLHRLSMKKAEEEIGFEMLRSNGKSRKVQNPRHRVISCSREKFDYSTNQDKHLVSLFFHGGGYFDASPSYWKGFEKLKILDLEDFGLKFLPESVGALIELRYLGLRNNYIKDLPQSLGRLINLEILDIDQNFIMEVPDIIWEMNSLRHIYMSDVICRKPLKIEALRNLQSLTYVAFDDWTYELSGLRKLTNLEKLGIEEVGEDSDMGKLLASLAKLEKLHHLILRGSRFKSLPCLDQLATPFLINRLKLDGRLLRLPHNFPRNMYCLTLTNSCLHEDPMPVLVKLSNLHNLKLRNAYIGREMVVLDNGFPELQVLCIQELQNLRNVRIGKGAMRRLNEVEINNCMLMETLPQEIGSTIHLKKLKMVTTKNIATKIRKSAVDSKIDVVDINP